MKLLFLKGLPASGKTTFARSFCAEHKDWIRVNRDDLRNMRGVYWIPKQEDMITEWENACIESALTSGYNVILDATNLNDGRNRARVEKLREQFPDLKVEYRFFDESLEECIKRDLVRPNSVGEVVIRRMYNKYLSPKPVVYDEDKSLPHCVIFDVDGTLAKMNGRGPYDWDKVRTDLVNEPIAFLNRSLAELNPQPKIFIFTGRDGSCLGDTEGWLVDNDIRYHDIFIRPAGNTEKDAVIKKRMFEENIKGKYYCRLVVDDRDQVVDMWRRELGLTCLQVDYGDF